MIKANFREHDVVVEKGRGSHERFSGNILYRSLIQIHKQSYNDLGAVDRSKVIGLIIDAIKEKDGWFVTVGEEGGERVPLAEEKVRKKVSDDLRREVRRQREKRSNKSAFSAKLKAMKEKETIVSSMSLMQPVNDPKPTDVLFGAGSRRHAGNKSYWDLMKQNLSNYMISPYGARSVISRNIVNGIKSLDGRFLEQDVDTGAWYEISDKRAIEKTSHALSNKKYKNRKTGSVDEEEFGAEDDLSANVSIETEVPDSALRTKKYMLMKRIVSEEDAVGSKENTPQKEESREELVSDIRSNMTPKISRELALQADPELARHALSLATLSSYPVVSGSTGTQRYAQLRLSA